MDRGGEGTRVRGGGAEVLPGLHGQRAVLGALDAREVCLTVGVHAHLLHPPRGDCLVKRVEDNVATEEQVRLRAERVEDARELDADVARADGGGALWLLELEEAVQGDAELRAGDLVLGGDDGVAAGGDVDVVGFEDVLGLVLELDFNLVLGEEAAVALMVLDAVLGPVGRVDLVEAADVRIALLDEGGPVEDAVLPAGHLVPLGMDVEFLEEVGSMLHQLREA